MAVITERIELTESGGGIEHVTVANRGRSSVDLQGFNLRILNLETGDIDQNPKAS